MNATSDGISPRAGRLEWRRAIWDVSEVQTFFAVTGSLARPWLCPLHSLL